MFPNFVCNKLAYKCKIGREPSQFVDVDGATSCFHQLNEIKSNILARSSQSTRNQKLENKKNVNMCPDNFNIDTIKGRMYVGDSRKLSAIPTRMKKKKHV